MALLIEKTCIHLATEKGVKRTVTDIMCKCCSNLKRNLAFVWCLRDIQHCLYCPKQICTFLALNPSSKQVLA